MRSRRSTYRRLSPGLALAAALASAAAAAEPALIELPAPGAPWTMDVRYQGRRLRLPMPDGLAWLERRPDPESRRLLQLARYRPANLGLMRELARRTRAAPRWVQRPEYLRRLEEVVLSLFPGDAKNGNPLWLHEPLLRALPAGSQVHLFVPAPLFSAVGRRLEELDSSVRVARYAVPIWTRREGGVVLRHGTTRWAQDLLETVERPDGRPVVLAPVTRYQINDLTRSDNRYLARLGDAALPVHHLPLFFRGGNLLISESATRRTLWVGERELSNNAKDYYNSVFVLPDRDRVVDTLRTVNGAGEAVVIPNSEHLFHLDMALTFLGPGTAAVLDPVDSGAVSAEDRRVLAALRAALRARGYRIVSVPTTASRIAGYRSPVNGIPFTDTEGRPAMLVPRFPDAKGPDGLSLNARIGARYREAGVRVIWVEDRFHPFRGNLHCAMNVLR